MHLQLHVCWLRRNEVTRAEWILQSRQLSLDAWWVTVYRTWVREYGVECTVYCVLRTAYWSGIGRVQVFIPGVKRMSSMTAMTSISSGERQVLHDVLQWWRSWTFGIRETFLSADEWRMPGIWCNASEIGFPGVIMWINSEPCRYLGPLVRTTTTSYKYKISWILTLNFIFYSNS